MSESMSKQLGKALKQMREDAGISMSQLHKDTGIARSHLYRLEDGEITEPQPEILNQLANAFGVEPEDLYEIAWETTGTGPGLPSLPTYFRAKYDLNELQVAAVEAALAKVISDKDSSGQKRPKRRST